jgi:hypothetical protein
MKDQLSYNKNIESQIAQLVAALPFATNLEKVKAQVASLLMRRHR